MPFPTRRPTLSPIFVRCHNNASDLLASCQTDFKARERDANIMYPLALKLKNVESPSTPVYNNQPRSPLRTTSFTSMASSDTESSDDDEEPGAPSSRKADDQFWLSVWTGHGRQPAQLDMVLSCTSGPIGKYPIFLYSNLPDEDLSTAFVQPRIDALVVKLKSCVKFKRVFSVFGPVTLTQPFVQTWSNATGAVPVVDPYYAAKHTFCTHETLSTAPESPISGGFTLRLAELKDLKQAAQLCHGFAAGSDPFFLSEEGAVREAKGYIQARQMYVYDAHASASRQSEIASIVCVTRTSANVSAITKVYTNPAHRGRKCAEKLVRFVCAELLLHGDKTHVVLFVAHDNKAAEKVYDRVGFQGLLGKPRPDGVNDWIEIGFEDTEIGHW